MIPLIIQNQFYTIQNPQRFPIPQTSKWSETFFYCFLQQTGSSILLTSGSMPKLRIRIFTHFLTNPNKFYKCGLFTCCCLFRISKSNLCKEFVLSELVVGVLQPINYEGPLKLTYIPTPLLSCRGCFLR